MLLKALCLIQVRAAKKITKINSTQQPGNGRQPKHALRIMKLTAIILLSACITAGANGYSQKVTLSEKNASLEKVFGEIKKQVGFTFVYRDEWMLQSKKVNIKVENAPLEVALDACFKEQPFTYAIVEKTIVITPQKTIHSESILDEPPPPIDITGRVVNEKGEPVEGVSVSIKGTRKGAVTNANGEFSLSGVNRNATLVFTSTNMETLEMKVDGKTYLAVSLKTKVSSLTEVTISASTGYQTISKERATGSFDMIKGDQLDNPSTNIGSRLIGQAAGVQATVDVNGNPTFEIRGQTSLYANAAPLIVVDGFAIQGDFNSINPNDVESVTILKDAAAASIWGARSANGVIVVTTKKAKKGTPLKIDLNVFTRISKKFDLDYVNPLASSAQTVDYEKLLFSKNWTPLNNNGSLSNYYFAYSPASTAINEYNLGFITQADMNAKLEELRGLSNKKQISDLLLSNPVSTQVNLNLYGGSERMSNAFSLLYETNQSNFARTYYNRYMLNYRSSSKIFNWLDFNLTGMLQYNDINNSGVTLSDIQALAPYDMLLDKDGNYTNINKYYWPAMQRYVPMDKFPYPNWGYNPVQEIRNRDLTTKQINIRLQGGLTFHIIKGLTFDSKLQYERISYDNRGLYNDQTFYVRQKINQSTTWDPVANKLTPNLPKGGILTQSEQEVEAYNFRNQLNFDREFAGKHEITFVGGSEVNNIVSKANNYPTAYGYNDQTLTVGTFPNGPGGSFYRLKDWQGQDQNFPYTNSFSYRTDRYFSLYGNLAYTYNKKYTVSGSARTDASNLITDDPKYRYEPFWSIGGGWNILREDFMKGVNWLNDLRLRLTYGFNGNVDKSTAFMPLIAMGSSPNVYTGDFTATISSFGNPALRWERTGTWDFGVDFGMLKNKLFGKLDIYNKYGKDLIATVSIPAVNGTTSQKLNNAEMTNRGVELTLGTMLPLKGNDIVWQGSMNFSYNRNKITKLFVANYAAYSLTNGGTYAYVVGKNANTLWAFQYAGIRTADNEPTVKGSGKDVYDFTTWSPGDGRDYLLDMGTKVAPYGLGFTSQLKFYDFDFSFIVTGKFGHVFNRMSFNYPPLWVGRVLPNSALTEVMNGDPNKIVPLPLNQNEGQFYFWDRFYHYMSYLVENASHLRMQEINLTYHLPRKVLQHLRWKGDFRVYAQGNNLFTILANKYGEDPEYPKGFMKPMPQFTLGARFNF